MGRRWRRAGRERERASERARENGGARDGFRRKRPPRLSFPLKTQKQHNPHQPPLSESSEIVERSGVETRIKKAAGRRAIMAIPQWDYLLPLAVRHGLVTVTENVLKDL